MQAELSFLAQRPHEPLTLQRIVEASTPAKVAKLVHEELPELFAARVKHIEAVPGWADQPELVSIRDIFVQSFKDLRLSEPDLANAQSAASLSDFTEVIYSIRRRHRPVTVLLGEAMRKMRRGDADAESTFQAWADVFLSSRISTEMLTSHYTKIIEAAGVNPTQVGVVDTKCNPGQICQEAAEQVEKSFSEEAGAGDGIRITVQANNCINSQSEIEFSYIPRYLFYIVQELLRNSARATLEAKQAAAAAGTPGPGPIAVTVCADQTQVVIRISDHANGLFGNDEKIWSYQFSTSAQPLKAYMDCASPLSGWGMGVPLGRLYAEYLGGSMELMNMPGTGVDAYLFLKRIALDSGAGERAGQQAGQQAA